MRSLGRGVSSITFYLLSFFFVGPLQTSHFVIKLAFDDATI